VGDNDEIFCPISKEELLEVINHLKNPRALDLMVGVEFFEVSFEVVGDDLLRVVEEIQWLGKMPSSFNYTFIS